ALPLAALPVCCATGLHSIGPLAHWPIAPSTANASRLQGRAFSPAARYERAVVNVSDNEALSEASLPVERGIRWQGEKKMRGYSVVFALNGLGHKLVGNMIPLPPMGYHGRFPTGSPHPQILGTSILRCGSALQQGAADSRQNPCSLFPAQVNHSPPLQPLPGQRT